jgi:dipeptidase E
VFKLVRLYLSSFKLGNETQELVRMLPANRRTAYISNAMDYMTDLSRRERFEKDDIAGLRRLGMEVEELDLREFFGQKESLREKVAGCGVVWVSGGNTFVLRQAFKLSGLDEILLASVKRDFVYGGYSAGVCILAPTLKGIAPMDDPTAKPYGEVEVIWDGLGLLDYSIVPHYKSDHPETEAASRAAEYMAANGMPFRTLRDGEVIITEVT